MKKLLLPLIVLAVGLLSVPAMAKERAVAAIHDTAGQAIGMAYFHQTNVGVLITIESGGLTPGVHAVHLHSVGTCNPNFKAAGGHINPGKAGHGLKNADGPDNGDLPNLFVDQTGHTAVQFMTPWVSVSSGPVRLLDGDGSTLVIHAKGDDHITQPIGGAGDRVACGVVKPN
jgi:superoxide dismutase, Cu-Zn family